MRDLLSAVLVAVPFVLGTTTAASAAPAGQVVTTFADPRIDEASGLAVVGGLLVTVNDSGDTGRVFVVDPATGETVGVTRWPGEAVDDESLAPAGDDAVWVGDIGDNLAQRASVTVRRVPVGRGERDVDPTAYTLVYPDGPHDAETLVADEAGRLYVITKGLLGGTVYAAPARLGPGDNELTPIGDVLGIATDGFLTDDRLVVRNYTSAAVYEWPSLREVARVALPDQRQGEAIADDSSLPGPDGPEAISALVTSEGVGAQVLRVGLPTASSSPSSSPSSAASSPGSASSRTFSREDTELPEARPRDPSAWPWAFTGLLGVGALAVLARSLQKPRRR